GHRVPVVRRALEAALKRPDGPEAALKRPDGPEAALRRPDERGGRDVGDGGSARCGQCLAELGGPVGAVGAVVEDEGEPQALAGEVGTQTLGEGAVGGGEAEHVGPDGGVDDAGGSVVV